MYKKWLKFRINYLSFYGKWSEKIYYVEGVL